MKTKTLTCKSHIKYKIALGGPKLFAYSSQTSTSTSAPELAILPALDVAMLGLTANIGKLLTLLVSVGVLVLVM